MCCSVLQCVAVCVIYMLPARMDMCCSALQCVLQCVSVCVVVCCRRSEVHVASLDTCCSVLQCVVTDTTKLHDANFVDAHSHPYLMPNVISRHDTHCNTEQHTLQRRHTLQHRTTHTATQSDIATWRINRDSQPSYTRRQYRLPVSCSVQSCRDVMCSHVATWLWRCRYRKLAACNVQSYCDTMNSNVATWLQRCR